MHAILIFVAFWIICCVISMSGTMHMMTFSAAIARNTVLFTNTSSNHTRSMRAVCAWVRGHSSE